MLRHDSSNDFISSEIPIQSEQVKEGLIEVKRIFREFKVARDASEAENKLEKAISQCEHIVTISQKGSLDQAISYYRLSSLLVHKKNSECREPKCELS